MLTTVRPSCFTLSNTWQKVRCSNTRVSVPTDELEEEDDAESVDGFDTDRVGDMPGQPSLSEKFSLWFSVPRW